MVFKTKKVFAVIFTAKTFNYLLKKLSLFGYSEKAHFKSILDY